MWFQLHLYCGFHNSKSVIPLKEFLIQPIRSLYHLVCWKTDLKTPLKHQEMFSSISKIPCLLYDLSHALNTLVHRGAFFCVEKLYGFCSDRRSDVCGFVWSRGVPQSLIISQWLQYPSVLGKGGLQYHCTLAHSQMINSFLLTYCKPNIVANITTFLC